ncbi:DUF362 domain-containing protein [Geopsychrobacter electrodiphilus]|uniref:DUF362 domain-containing protein n=1 Tax=Geopsychrobacter electrodiphilus TaxID=225196 RepID=UPI00037103D6|nr:DUF362 domain-containing protein [Geopsychrobacter electrodiphilus]
MKKVSDLKDHCHVSLQSLADYAPDQTLAAVEQLLEPLGGMSRFVSPGQKVLLKPNLLAGKPAQKAVTTHPEIVRAVAILARKAGGIVSVGDSPGIGSAASVARKCGIMAIVKELGLHFSPFETSVKIHPQGRAFQKLEVAGELLEADVVINLPKLKTHQMMGLTCAVKNMFGAMIGLRKPRLHLQAGSDKTLFALMLLELCEQLKPALTIVDAVVGMEGDGPGSGDPVQIGVLLAGDTPLAVDAVAVELVGLQPGQVWTQKLALETGRRGAALKDVEIVGGSLTELRITGFKAAKNTDINGRMPAFMQRLLKQALTARPAPNHQLCTRCGICVSHCPPEAMAIKEQLLRINYKTCIRCFCCQELCPQGALSTRQGSLLKLAQLIKR